MARQRVVQAQAKTNDDILWTTLEVARFTGRAVQTLVNDRHNNRGLPYVKFQRSVRYWKSDVIAGFQQNRVIPANSCEG